MINTLSVSRSCAASHLAELNAEIFGLGRFHIFEYVVYQALAHLRSGNLAASAESIVLPCITATPWGSADPG